MNSKLKFNNCRVCDSVLSHSTYIRGEETGDKTELFNCNSCGSYYSKMEYDQKKENHFDSPYIDQYMNEVYVTNRTKGIISYLLEKKWISGKNVEFLDIGCGVGWSLVEAEKFGFNAYGIEPSVAAADYANKNLKVNVTNSVFCSELFKDKKFDFIMMDQVLEHVPNPRETLVDAFKLLKPGGIFFLSIPPVDWSRIMLSISYLLPIMLVGQLEQLRCISKLTSLANKYDAFSFPEGHINYFSTRSISILVEHCNAQLLEQYHIQKKRAKYFPMIKLSTGSFFIRKN